MPIQGDMTKSNDLDRLINETLNNYKRSIQNSNKWGENGPYRATGHAN